MKDEKEELKGSLRLLQNDYENLGVGIDLLEQEIYDDNTSSEKAGSLVNDIVLWVEGIEASIDTFDESIKMFQRKQIINNLED